MKLVGLEQLTAAEEPRSNRKRLMDGSTLCRTQAAYRDTVKAFCRDAEEKVDFPTNYPKAYPCVVRLRMSRWGEVSCHWQRLEDYKDKLLAQYREVQGD
jgi:hypothetical protein